MMNQKDIDQFDRLIRERMDQFNPPAPQGVWEGIASGNTAATAAGSSILGFKTVLIAGGISLAAGVGGWLLYGSTGEKEITPTTQAVMPTPSVNDREVGQQAVIDNKGAEDVVDAANPTMTKSDLAKESKTNKQFTANPSSAISTSGGNGLLPEGSGAMKEGAMGGTTGGAAAKTQEIPAYSEGNVNPNVDFDAPEVACLNSTVIIVNRSHPGIVKSCEWYLWEGNKKVLFSTSWNPGYVFTHAGTYRIQLVAHGEKGTKRDISKTVQINPVKAAFRFAPLQGNSIRFENESVNAERYIWNFGDGKVFESMASQPVMHDYEQPGKYAVKLVSINKNDCSDTMEQVITVESKVNPFTQKIPDVFTPNGDGWNERFVIPIEGEKSFHLVIINARGERVFESKEKGNTWDGSHYLSGVPLPEGAYQYVLKYTLTNGQEGTVNGRLELRRGGQ